MYRYIYIKLLQFNYLVLFHFYYMAMNLRIDIACMFIVFTVFMNCIIQLCNMTRYFHYFCIFIVPISF